MKREMLDSTIQSKTYKSLRLRSLQDFNGITVQFPAVETCVGKAKLIMNSSSGRTRQERTRQRKVTHPQASMTIKQHRT